MGEFCDCLLLLFTRQLNVYTLPLCAHIDVANTLKYSLCLPAKNERHIGHLSPTICGLFLSCIFCRTTSAKTFTELLSVRVDLYRQRNTRWSGLLKGVEGIARNPPPHPTTWALPPPSSSLPSPPFYWLTFQTAWTSSFIRQTHRNVHFDLGCVQFAHSCL